MQRKRLMFVVLAITIVFIACTEQDPLSSEVTLIGLQQSQTQDVILANGKIVKQETATLNIIKGSNLSSTPLPALINFDDDVPGQTPMTGGANQPTLLVNNPPSTTTLVQSGMNGINTQPVVVTVDNPSQFADVASALTPVVSSGIVRVEATVSFDKLTDGYFLQTAVTPATAVVTRLRVSAAGEIKEEKNQTEVGQYQPNQPFRVRMDIDMTEKTWSVTIDNELNGFNDDVEFENLAFLNPPNIIPSVGSVNASLNTFPTPAGQGVTTVAYDEISISLLPVSISITPLNPPIQIPAAGGSFQFMLSVTNNSALPQNIDLWNMITPPSGEPVGPTFGPFHPELAPGETLSKVLTQEVPGRPPVGAYTYTFNVGAFPGIIDDSDSFQFTKLSAPSALTKPSLKEASWRIASNADDWEIK